MPAPRATVALFKVVQKCHREKKVKGGRFLLLLPLFCRPPEWSSWAMNS